MACAHKLATFGHDVIIYEAREKGGGLNEFGIAAYKSNDDFAQKELEWLLSIGGIKIEYGKKIGSKIKAINKVKTKINKTKLDNANSTLDIAKQKAKAGKAKLDQTIFEI